MEIRCWLTVYANEFIAGFQARIGGIFFGYHLPYFERKNGFYKTRIAFVGHAVHEIYRHFDIDQLTVALDRVISAAVQKYVLVVNLIKILKRLAVDLYNFIAGLETHLLAQIVGNYTITRFGSRQIAFAVFVSNNGEDQNTNQHVNNYTAHH